MLRKQVKIMILQPHRGLISKLALSPTQRLVVVPRESLSKGKAEGRANTKAWSYRRLAIHPPALPATFSFVLSLCLPRAIQSALLNFFHIQSLCITDEKARPGKKRVFPGSIPDLLVLLWGSFPILCVPSLLQTPYHSKSPQRECSSLLN